MLRITCAGFTCSFQQSCTADILNKRPDFLFTNGRTREVKNGHLSSVKTRMPSSLHAFTRTSLRYPNLTAWEWLALHCHALRPGRLHDDAQFFLKTKILKYRRMWSRCTRIPWNVSKRTLKTENSRTASVYFTSQRLNLC